MWLSKEILNWHPKPSEYFSMDDRVWQRAYEIWGHAEDILSSQCSDFQLVDIITTLKRAINHRLKHLDAVYPLRQLFPNEKSKRLLDRLAYFNLVRPFMAEKLILIRNEIEHEDSSPPNRERCQELADFTWYFLRSTDKLLAYRIATFQLRPTNIPRTNKYYWIGIKIEPILKFSISGWVQPSLISIVPRSDWLQMKVDETENKGQLLTHISDKEKKYDNEHGGRGLYSDDLWFSGVLDIPIEDARGIYQLYFSIL